MIRTARAATGIVVTVAASLLAPLVAASAQQPRPARQPARRPAAPPPRPTTAPDTNGAARTADARARVGEAGRAAPGAGTLTVERIFGSAELRPAGAPGVQWMRDGRSYLEARPAAGGASLVRVDAATGAATVLVAAGALRDAAGRPIVPEDVQLSPDERRALVFSNSVPVWRTNTRGTYHVVDLATGRATPLVTVTTPGRPAAAAGGAAADTAGAPALGNARPARPGLPSFIGRGLASGAADADLQMFAKFSPDSRRVAYVRGNDLYVTELATGRTTRLTSDGSDDVINGTTDWVYEEELGLRDAFRWSPDSRRLAYWRFDQTAVPAYPVVNETAGQYPEVSVLRYPKAGAPNSRVTIGVVDAAGCPPRAGGCATRWLSAGPDTGQYLARLAWAGPDSVAVVRLPRAQDRLDLLMLSATSGEGRTVVTDRDSAYVDAEGEPVAWLPGGDRFLLRTDRGGWRGYELYDRAGRLVRRVTPPGADYLELSGLDAAGENGYFVAAAPTPAQRSVFRCAIAAAGAPACTRLTPERGSHALDVAPGGRYGVLSASRLGVPPRVALVALPDLRPVRTLEDNRAVAARLAALDVAAPEFLTVPMPDGTRLDAYRVVPPRFDSTKRHPVLMHVYGGPASPQVNDAWGGTRYLWHQLMAQRGYVVLVVDNRGAAWRGRDFRKVTQLALGVRESQDQIDAARWAAARPWADGRRVGLWGWSYGGYVTALSLARGGDVFRAGVAVAPVVDWRLYDTIYTERFMRTPAENARGYQASAVATYAPGMTARLLLVHGTGDDNVHPQNALVLAQTLQQLDKPFTMLLYPNKTHSIGGGRTQVHLFGALTRFLDESL